MSIRVVKDPSADLDYAIDWTYWLGATDTIVESSWLLPSNSGLVAHDDAILTGSQKTLVWLSGGTEQPSPVRVTNHIKTAEGREDDRSIYVIVRER